MGEGSYLWAYGVVPDSRPVPGGLVGVDGRPVEVLWHGDCGLVVSAVPPDRFTGEALQHRLEQLETLEDLARAHDAVLDRALAAGGVVPFRMCTLFETPERARAMLDAEGPRLRRTVARLRGRAEWGVKAFDRSHEQVAAAAAAPPASGAEYLARRRRERDEAEAGSRAVDALAAEVHGVLAERAVAAVVARPQDRRLSGRDAAMVLNAAYLVPDAEREAFAALVADVGARTEGLDLELTGPWPAYSFVVEAGT